MTPMCVKMSTVELLCMFLMSLHAFFTTLFIYKYK